MSDPATPDWDTDAEEVFRIEQVYHYLCYMIVYGARVTKRDEFKRSGVLSKIKRMAAEEDRHRTVTDE